MRVMPSNWSKGLVHYWAGCFPNLLGHLYSPGFQRGPYPWLPYALDNGAFGVWTKGIPWDEAAYYQLLSWAAKAEHAPLWALVPDVVADRDATIARWHEWAPRLRLYGWPLAFAVQDGMTPADVPRDAEVVFVGGSTQHGSCKGWKWETLSLWCSSFPRVHVGRVNGYAGLRRCLEAGAESCDGTGWTKGRREQLAELERYLEERCGVRL